MARSSGMLLCLCIVLLLVTNIAAVEQTQVTGQSLSTLACIDTARLQFLECCLFLVSTDFDSFVSDTDVACSRKQYVVLYCIVL